MTSKTGKLFALMSGRICSNKNVEGVSEWTSTDRKTNTEVDKCYTQKHKDTKETSIQRKGAQD